MADENLIGEIGGQLVSTIFSSILFFGIVIILMIGVGGFMYYQFVYKRKFDILVKITSNRANENNSVLIDKAAILYELKSKIPYFRIWGLKRDFPVPKYNVLQKTNRGDYLELYRDSEESFYFLTPSQINKSYMIKSEGQLVKVADQEQIMVDPEMGFWAVKRKALNKKMFDTEGLIMKLLPYVPQIIGGVITIFVLYILMDTLPGILAELAKLARTLNEQSASTLVG